MTIFDLFKKHQAGEVSKEKFLYEARRDQNLPWILNTTSYDDAVKILKNKGIIKESDKPKPYRSPDKDATYIPGEPGKFKSDVRPAFQPKKTAAVRGGEVKVGDKVNEKDDLVELTTDKATFNLPSPCAGILSQVFFQEGDAAKIGEMLAIIEEG